MSQHTRPSLCLGMVQLSLEDEHFLPTSTTTTPGSPQTSTFPPTDNLIFAASSHPVLSQISEVCKANGFHPLDADEETRDYEPDADRPSAYDNWQRWVELNVPQQHQWANEACIEPERKHVPSALQLKQGKLIHKRPAKATTELLQRPRKARLAFRSVNLDWDVEPATLPSTAFSPVLDLKAKRPTLKVRTTFHLPALPAMVYQPPAVATRKRPAPLELFRLSRGRRR